jgi:hypothetical protein
MVLYLRCSASAMLKATVNTSARYWLWVILTESNAKDKATKNAVLIFLKFIAL